jgi:hypothetical protein
VGNGLHQKLLSERGEVTAGRLAHLVARQKHGGRRKVRGPLLALEKREGVVHEYIQLAIFVQARATTYINHNRSPPRTW